MPEVLGLIISFYHVMKMIAFRFSRQTIAKTIPWVFAFYMCVICHLVSQFIVVEIKYEEEDTDIFDSKLFIDNIDQFVAFLLLFFLMFGLHSIVRKEEISYYSNSLRSESSEVSTFHYKKTRFSIPQLSLKSSAATSTRKTQGSNDQHKSRMTEILESKQQSKSSIN